MWGRYFFIGVAALMLAVFSYADESEPIKLKSWTSLKHERVVQQGLDYSCGSASIATILRYYFGDDWREDVIIADTTLRMSEQVLTDRIKNGFSMMDMKQTLIRLGYQAAGVKLTTEQAAKLKGPVIVLLYKETSNHFVVLRGIKNDEAFLSDPTAGNVRISIDEFSQQWKGEALIIGKANTDIKALTGLNVNANETYHPELDAVVNWRRISQ
jgi:hypothetical protein